MAKQRNHNEYFRPVSLGNRKSCPACGAKLHGQPIWSWGEYIRTKWHTVTHFCAQCYQTNVAARLQPHANQCGCTITLVLYSGTRPAWMHEQFAPCTPVPPPVQGVAV